MRGINGTQGISKDKWGFIVYHDENKKRHYIGHAKTLIQALMMKDWSKQNNWKKYPKSTKTNEKFIIIDNTSGRYTVRKVIHGIRRQYGTFDTVDEAIIWRDYCIQKGWSSNLLHEFKLTHKPLRHIGQFITKDNKVRYFIRHRENGKMESYGTFGNLEDALKERDLLEKYKWDWDLIVEDKLTNEEWLNGITIGSTFQKLPKGRNDYFIAKNSGII